ncbi:MAG: hypothetical protein D6714_15120 [Bacteroidetes bacterium]|nr:MAG: hypothetical protein D6714_15120 [Bacteroidota bacterium]
MPRFQRKPGRLRDCPTKLSRKLIFSRKPALNWFRGISWAEVPDFRCFYLFRLPFFRVYLFKALAISALFEKTVFTHIGNYLAGNCFICLSFQ